MESLRWSWATAGLASLPVRRGSEKWLIELMEGVEDIPGAALSEGMKWGWESFSEYLEVLSRRELAIDVAAMVPHGAIRYYVMGERGANNEASTPMKRRRWRSWCGRRSERARPVSRPRASTGIRRWTGVRCPAPLPRPEELLAIAREMRKAGRGVFEVIPSGTIGQITGIKPDTYSLDRRMELDATLRT